MEDVKNQMQILELKNTITETKNSMGRLNRKVEEKEMNVQTN
jgi:hypothetical protein